MKSHGNGSRKVTARGLAGRRLAGMSRLWVIGSVALIVAGLLPATALAQSGTWSQAGAAPPYNWSDATNWSGGIIADGANNTATFATAGLTANQGVTLDSARTIGSLVFDNPTNNFGWSIGGTNILTLSNTTAPTIAVNKAGITASLSVPLAGTQGFTKTGPGTLSLSGAGDGLSGPINLSTGTLKSTGGSLGSGTINLASGTTLGVTSIAASGFGGLGTGWTANGTAQFPVNDTLQLTDAINGQTGSAWFNTPVSVRGPYTIKLTYTTLTGSGTPADGFTIGFQNDPAGTAFLGGGGGALGWTNITNAAAFAFNIYAPNTKGVKAVYTGTGGVGTGAPYISMAPVNPTSFNNPVNVTINYDGTKFTGTLVQGANTFTIPALTFPDIATIVGGSTAIFGFTGATGGENAQQQISNFSISQGYANAVSLAAGTETIQVLASAVSPNVTMGALTAADGSTLNVSPDAGTPANQAFGLTLGAATLNGATTFNVANNGTGTGTLTLGALSNGTGTASITKTGAGNMIVGGGTIGGGLTVNSGTFSTTANLTVGSLAGTGGTVNNLSSGAVTLTVGSDNTSTSYAGNIVDGATGSLGLVKVGTGMLSLTGTNSFSGGLAINAGTVSVSSDAAAGTGPVTIGVLGTLNYSATTATTKSFNLGGGTLSASGGATVTLNGGTVTSGYLGGAGTFATGAGGVVFGNMTTRPAVTIASNSSRDQFVNFTNGGTLNVAAGLSSPVTLSGFTNQGSGTVNVGAGSKVSASDFQSSGVLNLAAGTASVPTVLTNTGSSKLFFNGGSRTFIATPTSPQFTAGIDLNGKNAVVAGGLFVNNGYVIDSTNGPATVVADFGSLVKGAGFYQNGVITINGGKFQAGNSPGVATLGSFTLGAGGVSNYVFAIDNATGAAGPSPNASGLVSGWGLVKAVQKSLGLTSTAGNFSFTADAAHKVTVALDTLVDPTKVGTDVPGKMANFDPSKSYSWSAVRWSGNYSGPTDPAVLDAATAFDTSGFLNPVTGTFGWSLDAGGHGLSLTYSPTAVPEPGTLALVGFAAAGFAWRRRSRRAR
ncbi:MAG TPA: autotransporter-associated beta strand repeat-containing protein [Gemmataceae bacterium]|nr:autotransporter-associated beta strand repeat-containing protein [Gemmataceae bacterium]